jgi:hypothetical protein
MRRDTIDPWRKKAAAQGMKQGIGLTYLMTGQHQAQTAQKTREYWQIRKGLCKHIPPGGSVGAQVLGICSLSSLNVFGYQL